MTEEYLIKFSNIDTKPFEEFVKKSNLKEVDIADRSTKGNSKQWNFVDLTELSFIFLPYLQENIDLIGHKKLKASQAWLVEGNKGSYHRLHNHAIAKEGAKYKKGLACVLYLEVPDGEDRGEFYYLLRKKDATIGGTFQPNKGDLVIMPKSVYHGVYPQKSEGVRRTLNFDYEELE